MKLAFVVDSILLCGGINVIIEHCCNTMNNGIDVVVITNKRVDSSDADWHPDSRRITWNIYEEVQDVEFDLVIATWWKTAYELYKFKAKAYAYFVQSIESRFYGDDEFLFKSFAEGSYLLPVKIITEAEWIRDYLKQHYDLDAYLVYNGIRKDFFCLEGDSYDVRTPGKLRVLIEGPLDVSFKNVRKTIDLCNKSLADEIWLLTSTLVKECPGVDRVFSRIPINETPLVYRSCDVLIKLSYVEGMFGPPLEMFHCGGTAITYNVTGHDQYIVHGENALVAKTDDEEAVLSHINRLKEDRGLLCKLQRGAIHTALLWPDWRISSMQLMDAVRDILNKSSYNQETQRKKIEVLNDLCMCAERLSCELSQRNSRIADLENMLRSPVRYIMRTVSFLFRYVRGGK